jgi:hypothetical protein
LKPEHDQVVRVAIEIYWDEDGVYNEGLVEKGEEVQL